MVSFVVIDLRSLLSWQRYHSTVINNEIKRRTYAERVWSFRVLVWLSTLWYIMNSCWAIYVYEYCCHLVFVCKSIFAWRVEIWIWMFAQCETDRHVKTLNFVSFVFNSFHRFFCFSDLFLGQEAHLAICRRCCLSPTENGFSRIWAFSQSTIQTTSTSTEVEIVICSGTTAASGMNDRWL